MRQTLQRCLGPNSSSCYYGFEPNPVFTQSLLQLESQRRKMGIRVHVQTRTAFGVRDGTAQLHIDNESHHLGSSLRSIAASGAVETVREIDGARFLHELKQYSGFIAAKLDVEGYEYELLPHLLRNGAACGVVALLAVEWHSAANVTLGHALGALRSVNETMPELLTRQLESLDCRAVALSWV